MYVCTHTCTNTCIRTNIHTYRNKHHTETSMLTHIKRRYISQHRSCMEKLEPTTIHQRKLQHNVCRCVWYWCHSYFPYTVIVCHHTSVCLTRCCMWATACHYRDVCLTVFCTLVKTFLGYIQYWPVCLIQLCYERKKKNKWIIRILTRWPFISLTYIHVYGHPFSVC